MRSLRTNYIYVLFKTTGLLFLLLLSACNRSGYIPENEVPKLPCRVDGACDATIIKMMTDLNKKGIKVASVGQNYLISIPASALFADQSPRLNWASYSLLNEVAAFLKQFRKIAITVTSYSSKYVSVKRERALTLARSRVVSEYLWSQGVDSRIIFTQGLGSDKPITSYTLGGDRSPNARVEITFRRAVA
ncbi:TPA: type IVB secretion system protein IcmN/DotK [Legionella pneumophila]|uniref:OmpA family protein n=1 Tax=Legionella pneumophila subsp. pneumophila TaxID=91891 RepID=A0A3A6UU20_LEGPN|nr:type IVB secretion system protein IcmN/DotK [Legionella pneumophila]ERH41635.1 protein LphA [Legionella pneumophila str. Leg01/11]ERH42650.1 protein LphA [Legionella pneumophila str. Leg01/53]ERI46389.1 protein LphA [Legionella pneumophila str. Leg01/20]AMQ26948.1 protein LphA [Legionella pneumophila subsp. pneumophila]AMV13209.1 putative lipoprotein YiaD precursor [Legionella pneumophila]